MSKRREPVTALRCKLGIHSYKTVSMSVETKEVETDAAVIEKNKYYDNKKCRLCGKEKQSRLLARASDSKYVTEWKDQ